MKTVQSILTALENAPQLVIPLVQEVPDLILKRRSLPNKWSAHEHAFYLAAVHPIFFSRLDLMLSNLHPVIEPYLPDRDDNDEALVKMNLDQALKNYARDRGILVESLSELNKK